MNQYNALAAAAPALLAAVEQAQRWLIAERDCLYEGAANDDGVVVHQEDIDALAEIDRDIDELGELIRAARGDA